MNKVKYILGMAIILSSLGAFHVFAQGSNVQDNTNTASPAMRRGGWQGRGVNGGQQRNNAGGQQGNAANFCSRIANMETQFDQRISQKKSPADRLTQWQQHISQQDSNRTALRTKWSANRDAQFKSLENRATTDDQKAAVSAFESTTKDAISKRETAVDAALATFRDGVKNLIDSRKEGVGTDMTALKDAIDAAFSTAKSSCSGSNPDAASIRTTLRTAIQAARTKFQTEKQGTPKVGENIQPLIDARKASVDKAMADFKATMEQARTTLKKAFGQDAN